MEIQEGISAKVEGSSITVKGPKGELRLSFPPLSAKVSVKGKEIEVDAEKRLANTLLSHIRNMCAGVSGGYSKKLKILYSHFPLSIEVKGDMVHIKNFLGEKQNRRAKVVGGTRVEAKGPEVTVSGISKEEVGQTIANIKSATRIKRRDSRVFQDGLYEIPEE